MICNHDSLSFNILTVEHIAHTSKTFSVKARPYAALSFRITGESIFDICEKTLVANAGDVVFIPANTPYKVEYSFSEIIVVHLLNCNYDEPECMRIENKEVLSTLFNKMLENWKVNKSVNRAKAYLYEILYKLEDGQNSRGSERPAEFERCLTFLEEHFANSDLKIELLCEYGYISRSSLQRYFLRYLGVSPKQYLLDLRLNKAVELLASDTMSVAEIAEHCGFKDEKYFSRIFKQSYGITPTDARHRTHI